MNPLLLLLLASLALATANTDAAAAAEPPSVCERLCSDFFANDLGDDSCRGALKMNPRPTTYNACRRGREKGHRDACIPSCTATELSKPNSFAACEGSKSKKRRPNNPFARCRRAYEVAFEETQRGIVERVREIAAEATVVEDVAEESVVNDDDSQPQEQPPITEDVALRQLEESEEDRPTPYQAPPTDGVTEGAIESELKEESAEDAAAIESITSTTEVAEEEDKGSAAQESIVDEPLEEGPGVSETSLNHHQPDDANESPSTEVTRPTDPTEPENVLDSSSPGIDGPQESVSGDLNDDEATTVDASASTRNHVSLDSEKTPIVDL